MCPAQCIRSRRTFVHRHRHQPHQPHALPPAPRVTDPIAQSQHFPLDNARQSSVCQSSVIHTPRFAFPDTRSSRVFLNHRSARSLALHGAFPLCRSLAPHSASSLSRSLVLQNATPEDKQCFASNDSGSKRACTRSATLSSARNV